MSPILAVIGLAILAGLIAGGSLRNFERLHVHWWALVFIGLALQIVAVPRFGSVPVWAIGAGLLIASYVLLLAFLTVNRWIPGAAVMAVGLLMNLTVVVANGGMPVSAAAVETAGGTAAVLATDAGAKHHLMNDRDLFSPLGGDILLYAGMAWFVFQVMRGRNRESPRPIAMWFLTYRGKHAPGHWRLAARYRAAHPVGAERSGTER